MALLLAVLVAGAAPVGYTVWRKAHARAQTQTELDRLPVPQSWTRGGFDDRYEGPRFGGSVHASVFRHYRSLPDPPEVIMAATARAATAAGWTATGDLPDEQGGLPPCGNDGCWAKGAYRLILSVDTFSPSPTEPQLRPHSTCPNPPHAECSSFWLEIAYEP